jgi:hypothetical protein
MDSKTIEKADRKFIDELPQYRSKLARRQKAYRDRSIQKGIRLPLVQIIAPIFIAVVGVVAIFLMPDKLPSGSPSVDSEVEVMQTQQPRAAAGMAASAAGIGKNSFATGKAAGQRPAPLKKRHQGNSAIIQADKTKPEKEYDAGNRVAAESASEVSVGKQVSLVSAVVCEGVQDHQPMVEKNEFLTADSRRAYVWMEIRSKKQPFVIKHNYYLNGAKHSEVPLEIKYPRMRTWSYVTINKPDHIGDWKVDIVRDNNILKTIEFRVGAGNQ